MPVPGLQLLRTVGPVLCVLACSVVQAQAQAPAAPVAAGSAVEPKTRGQALYTTHCIACHDTQIHWRDQKLATDWTSLKAQVRRWQATAVLGWREADIVDVARYLNDTIYKYKQTTDLVSRLDLRP